MNEFELIDRFFSRSLADPDVLVGIGDDGAVLRPAAGRDLVVVADTLVEGVHFPRNMDAADVAWRSVAVNLSDIAAMAARPRWMTLAITLAANDVQWLEGFSLGLFEIADQYSVELIGGDTTSGQETVVTVQIIGDVDPGSAIRRSGASPGDAIYVTGTPGDAGGGLALWQSNDSQSEDAQYLVKRFARPTPRIEFALRLANLASAAIDVSDGLFADVSKLLLASEAGGRLDVDCLPLSTSLTAMHGLEAAVRYALGGGDDYEIAFTAPGSNSEAIERLAQECELPVTRIGEVTSGTGLQCHRGEHRFDYQHAGYRHFE